MRDLERYKFFTFEVTVLLRHESTVSFPFHGSSISGTEQRKIFEYTIPRNQLLQMDDDNYLAGRDQYNNPTFWSRDDTPEKTFSIWLRLNNVWHSYMLGEVKLIRAA